MKQKGRDQRGGGKACLHLRMKRLDRDREVKMTDKLTH